MATAAWAWASTSPRARSTRTVSRSTCRTRRLPAACRLPAGELNERISGPAGYSSGQRPARRLRRGIANSTGETQMSKGFFCLAAVALLLAVDAGDGWRFPAPADGANNPPPKEAFSAFQRFEAQPIAMGAPWPGRTPTKRLRPCCRRIFDERLKPLLAEWNAKAAGMPGTLRIEPMVRYIRYITGGKQLLGGGFAGNSAVSDLAEDHRCGDRRRDRRAGFLPARERSWARHGRSAPPTRPC